MVERLHEVVLRKEAVAFARVQLLNHGGITENIESSFVQIDPILSALNLILTMPNECFEKGKRHNLKKIKGGLLEGLNCDLVGGKDIVEFLPRLYQIIDS